MASGIDVIRLSPGTSSHHSRPEQFVQGPVKKFCFVRHPLSWYQSYWADRYFRGWGGDLDIAHSCGGMGFNEFVLCVTQRHPGRYSRLLEEYTHGCQFIGKTESLRDDLLQILDDSGERYDAQRIDMVNHLQVTSNSPVIQRLTQYSPEAKRTLLLTEQSAINRWYPPSSC